jgi:hypothetical protein
MASSRRPGTVSPRSPELYPTSPAQFYRLLDQTNYSESVDRLVTLLQALDCDVRLSVRARPA